MSVEAYYCSRINELTSRAEWARSLLSGAVAAGHTRLAEHAKRDLVQVSDTIAQMKALLQSGRPQYLGRVREYSLMVEGSIDGILANFLWPIAKENNMEVQTYPLLARLCHEAGYREADEILCSLGHPLAVFPFYLDCPVFFLPAEITASTRWWPALFHEVGHLCVNADRKRLLGSLMAVVDQHYNEKIISAGPMAQSDYESRLRSVQTARRYWLDDEGRVEEVFCDVFGTYCCGLAYAFTLCDVAISSERSPKTVRGSDPHPPVSMRFQICWDALPRDLQYAPVGQSIWKVWEDYQANSIPPRNTDSLVYEYGLTCSTALAQTLADACLDLISSLHLEVKRWTEVPAPIPGDRHPNSIAEAVNACLLGKMTAPQTSLVVDSCVVSAFCGVTQP